MADEPTPVPTSTGRAVLSCMLLVGAAAIILRAFYLRAYASSLPFLDQPVLDAAYYDSWARRMMAGALFPAGPFYQPPGYPGFVAIIYSLLGPEPRNVAIVQAFLGVLSTMGTMLIAWLLFGNLKETTLAGILMLGAGTLLFMESKLLVESWALFLLVLSTIFVLLADRGLPSAGTPEERRSLDRAIADGWRPRPPSGHAGLAAFAAGLLAGVAAASRANLVVVPGLYVLIALSRSLARRRPWATTLLYAAGLLLALLPTAVHNIRHGSFAQVATSGGLNFYIGNHQGARGIYEDPPGFSGVVAFQEAEADSLVEADLGRVLPPGPESGYWFSRGVREITQDFPGWLGLVARKAWLFVNRQEEENNGCYGLEASRIRVLRIAALPFNFFVFAGAVGLLLASGTGPFRRGARADLTGPVLVLLGVLVTAILFFVMARLRIAAIPMLAVFAAHALSRLDLAWRAGHLKAIALFLLAGAVFIALSWRSPLGPARSPRWEAQLFVATGSGLEAAGKREPAGKAYEEAIRIDPDNVDAWIRLGQLALERRDLVSAIRQFEGARRAAPGHFGVRNNLGILYYQAQRFQESDSEMVEAIRIQPDQAGPFFYRGLVARRREDPEAAIRYFIESLELDPNFTGAYVRLIETFLDLGRLKEARHWANQAGERAVALPASLAERLR